MKIKKIIGRFIIALLFCFLLLCTIKNIKGEILLSRTKDGSFKEISNEIYEKVTPLGLGAENGVDVTSYFANKIYVGQKIDELSEELKKNGYTLDIRFGRNLEYPYAAVHNFYSQDFFIKTHRTILIKVDLNKDKDEVVRFKVIYFTHFPL
ncbi:hypothetical protein [Paralysiella testudinis]|uniref:Uncharacterized protein n=1 Tax=Paralysiella testudinis TaxID=2809020 RepID=A0A892ZF07_9NEIS|nr:hypothetical protein [Paralysiella testudinis]QRQ82005.1 hypothetical protein JQU52_00730 [Paralysiella testudinis]